MNAKLEQRRKNSAKKNDGQEDLISLSVDWQNYHTVPGRIVLCGWRTIKYSLTLNNYSFENAVYHILHERVPRYQFSTITSFYLSQSLELETLVFAYYLTRAMGNLRMLLQVRKRALLTRCDVCHLRVMHVPSPPVFSFAT